MRIILRRMNRHLPEYRQVRQLYKTAFPLAERVPFGIMMRRSGVEGVDFWAIYARQTAKNGDCSREMIRWVGFAYVISHEKLSYLFYLAINDDCRGKGYGSAVLRTIRKKYAGRKLFLAIEQIDEAAPNLEERTKRKHFYQKNGFSELHCKLREMRMVYEVLGTEGPVSSTDFQYMMRRYFGPVWKHIITTEILT